MKRCFPPRIFRGPLGLVLVLVLVVLLPSLAYRLRPEPLPPQARPLVLAFSGSDPEETLHGIRRELRGNVDVISPHWIRFNGKGQTVLRRSSQAVIDAAHKQGIEVWPLVAYSGPYGQEAGCPVVFCDSDSAARLVQSLTTWALEQNMDGLVLDVEYLSSTVAPYLVVFTSQLHRQLTTRGLKLWVAVFPQVDFPEELSSLHDIAGLSEVCDGLILMAYDRHGPRTAPGPIAPFEWVKENVEEMLEKIPPTDLLLGIPSYGYVWRRRAGGWKTEVLPGRRATALSESEQHGGPAFLNGGEAWWESIDGGLQKAMLARSMGLRGLAVWRYGLEPPSLWPKIKSQLHNTCDQSF